MEGQMSESANPRIERRVESAKRYRNLSEHIEIFNPRNPTKSVVITITFHAQFGVDLLPQIC